MVPRISTRYHLTLYASISLIVLWLAINSFTALSWQSAQIVKCLAQHLQYIRAIQWFI